MMVQAHQWDVAIFLAGHGLDVHPLTDYTLEP